MRFDHLHFKSDAASHKKPVERTQEYGDVREFGKMERNISSCILNHLQGLYCMHLPGVQCGTV